MATQAVFFTKTYDETLAMIVEARDYMTGYGRQSPPRSGGLWQLQFSCEALRVTSRLTQALAWLMLQRAVSEGEISAIEACQSHHRLSGQDVCLNINAANDIKLPEKLLSLMQRSYSLYNRISRLEEMVIERVTTSPERSRVLQ